MAFSKIISEILVTEYKFLTFKPARPDIQNLGNWYLMFGLVTTWLAGVGRYWDNPRAELWQYLGAGSIAYVFSLTLILWLLILPLRPQNWQFKSILIFVTMTSPPALLYAIPVERFYSLQTAQSLNVLFLAVVAAWRVALLFKYLRQSAKLTGASIVVAALMPLTIIVTALTFLNLEHVVFKLMAGLSSDERSANDSAYGVLWLITSFSVLASPILLIAYIGLVINGFSSSGDKKKNSHSDLP